MVVDRSVRFRATTPQIIITVVPVAATWTLLLGGTAVMVGAGGNTILLGSLAMATTVAITVLLRWRGLELTGEHAVVRGDTTKRIRWDDVIDVRVRRRFGARTVVLHTQARRVRCPAPYSTLLSQDRHFDEKFRYIVRWWLACVPGAASSPRSETGWGHPVLPGEAPV